MVESFKNPDEGGKQPREDAWYHFHLPTRTSLQTGVCKDVLVRRIMFLKVQLMFFYAYCALGFMELLNSTIKKRAW